uniref:PAW domain-containing protein n=1 Tax=Timema douglasi TaxID=61478 RepID=A0A7R8Z8P8_TIMDO|nr:unnamed protein product [Timema douglasi]
MFLSGVYSATQKRWLHCDPCENVCDAPLMYETGWGKKLSYVIAYSCDEVQDVSWRYSCDHAGILARRTQCTEEDLLRLMLAMREERQHMLSPARKAYINRRLVLELVEFFTQKKPTDTDYQGRSSGSLSWRLARDETRDEAVFTPHTWRPTAPELEAREMHIRYSTAQDKYVQGTLNQQVELLGWRNGAHLVSKVFRKEETDWKMVYVARKGVDGIPNSREFIHSRESGGNGQGSGWEINPAYGSSRYSWPNLIGDSYLLCSVANLEGEGGILLPVMRQTSWEA